MCTGGGGGQERDGNNENNIQLPMKDRMVLEVLRVERKRRVDLYKEHLIIVIMD